MSPTSEGSNPQKHQKMVGQAISNAGAGTGPCPSPSFIACSMAAKDVILVTVDLRNKSDVGDCELPSSRVKAYILCM